MQHPPRILIRLAASGTGLAHSTTATGLPEECAIVYRVWLYRGTDMEYDGTMQSGTYTTCSGTAQRGTDAGYGGTRALLR
eukprot:1680964-Rhodomonas_salina.1